MAATLFQLLTIFFVVAIFSFKLGSGELLCWRCDPCPDPHDNSSSMVSAVTCTSSQTVCVKNTIKVLNRQSQISKGCVASCTPSSSNFFGQGAFVDCCNTNFCNFATRNHFSFLCLAIWMFAFYYQ